MFHLLFTGLLLGWGAAAPIGPLNLEIIRRNLNFGFLSGLALAIGASSGDVTYLSLLSVGDLALLKHTLIQRMFSFIGACILGWFGYQALFKTPSENHSIHHPPKSYKSIWRHAVEGYLLVLVNPYTVLFWLSVSSQVALLGGTHKSALFLGCGVILGVFSWALGINIFIHRLKHKLSSKSMYLINRLGGLIIVGFSLFFLYRAFFTC